MPTLICYRMITKGNESNQARHLTLRIANIKFSVLHRAPRKKSQSNPFLPATTKQPPQAEEPKERMRAISRNSFIPSTSIKSQAQVERSRQYVNAPLFPADVTYSKFPMRRPKSIKPRNYFPVFRQRIVSTSPQRALNLSQQSFESQAKQRRKIRGVVHSRTTTKSCLALNQTEKETFVRYSHINSQDCSEMKVQTEREEEELRQTCL